MQDELNSACETLTLKRVIRLDSVPVHKADFTEEGYLVDHPILTTTGIFEYTNPDGSTRRELRLPSEVFDEESLKSYKGKPIVITHDAGLITKENVGKEMIGTILSDGYRDQDSVRAEIVIHDTDEMKQSGLKELSLGYNLELDETPGVWNGQHYDAVQRNIRINHLALVREARAGDNARLNIDSRDENVLKGGIVMTASKKRKHTARADGILSEEELAKAIEEYKKRHPKADADKPDEDEVEETVVEAVKEDSHDDKIPSFAKGDLTAKINKCLLNRDERDDEGDPDPDDPDHYNKLMNTIARQDEDLQTLFDIIDTLLAEKDFGAEKKEDADDKKEPEDEEDLLVEEEETEEDGDDEDEDVIKVNAAGEELDGDDEDVDIDIDVPDDDDEDDEDENEDACKSDEDDDVDVDIDLPDDDEENEDEDDDEDKDVDIDIDLPDDDDKDEDDDDDEEDIEVDGDDEEEDVEVEDLFKKRKGVNADSVDAIVRTRVKIGMVGRSLNMDGLENKDIRDAMRAIIRKVRPTMRLDGKSDTYIKAAFDMACDEVKENEKAPKGVDYQRRQMYNRKTVRNDSSDRGGAEAARKRMIKNMNIKKEDK